MKITKINRIIVIIIAASIIFGSYSLIKYLSDRQLIGKILVSGETVLTESYEDQIDSFSVFDLVLSNLPTAYIDLDTGVVGESSESDLYFGMTSGSDTFPFIRPVNGAKIFFFGNEEPKFEDCMGKFDDIDNYSVNPGPNYYYCVQTNQGNISFLHRKEEQYMNEVNEYFSLKISIFVDYKTWGNLE